MKYIVQTLGQELLVYDTETHQASALEAEAASAYYSAQTDTERRAVLAGAVTGVFTMLAPTVAQACSAPNATKHCGRGENGRTCDRADGACGRCFAGSCL